jgi:RNA polymerase sigma-70 factor (ECF subfamily)
MMLKKETKQQQSDKEIMSLLQNGDDSALNEIMSRYKQKLFAFIYSYTKSEETSEEILQEVFIKLYFKAKTYNPRYGFSTWIHQIAINLCHDYYKKQKLTNLLSLDRNFKEDEKVNYHDILADPNSNVENLVQLRQDIAILDKEINKLPHKLKTALILFVLEGYSQEKCANILNVTSKTIETRIYRARKILAKKIAINF